MLKFDSLNDVVVSKKVVLLRCDFNVPIKDGLIKDDTRIQAALHTIRYLISNYAKVLICTHFGSNENYSTQIIAEYLKDYLNTRVHYVSDMIGQEVKTKLEEIEYGDVLVLENVRFYEEESVNDFVFARELGDLCDIYVNEAFSCSHRNHASIVGVTKHVYKAVAGFLFIKEYNEINSLLESKRHPCLAILGGSKISTKIGIVRNLMAKVDAIFLCGGLLNTYLKVCKYNIGKSLSEEGYDDFVNEIRLHSNRCRVILPTHVNVEDINNEFQTREIALIQDGDRILDIAFEGMKNLLETIDSVKCVIWNGPLGYYEDERFIQGSVVVAQAIAKATKSGRLHSFAGGGDVVACINKAGVFEDFSFISTSGGSCLKMLGGKELEGVLALVNNKKADPDSFR
jgi:phosphoglycerate kinase